MEKGILFLTLSVACGWLILDEFFGKQYVSKLANNFVPDISLPTKEEILGVDEKTKKKKGTDHQKVKDAITKNPKLNNKVKDALKDAVDEFYRTTPQLEEA